MHDKISIAFPTWHRKQPLKTLLDSVIATTTEENRPMVTSIHDNPKSDCDSVVQSNELVGKYDWYRNIHMPHKSSLAHLWNLCVINSPTDWVLVCNDDIEFQPGWLEYIEKKIEEGEHKEIRLACFAGFCIHKSMILKLGWFDERFGGGAFEDHDWQLRIGESDLRDLVDLTYDSGDINGKYIKHIKDYEYKTWQDNGNAAWQLQKWGRTDLWDYRIPSYRREPEIDWHPLYTRLYSEKYGEESRIDYINENYAHSDKRVFIGKLD